MRKSLNIIKESHAEHINKRLDITTADEKIKSGQMSDSEKMIAADMRRYMNDAQKQFELITNMKKSNNTKNITEPVITEDIKKESYLMKVIKFIKLYIKRFI